MEPAQAKSIADPPPVSQYTSSGTIERYSNFKRLLQKNKWR